MHIKIIAGKGWRKNMELVLVTGGVGFIGSFTVDLLLQRGYQVRVFDNLEPQVHGVDGKVPDYLDPDVQLLRGEVCNYDDLSRAVEGVDAIIHLAASVGVGQSMYQIQKYTFSNTLGTANLLDIIVNEETDVRKLVVASSMSVYGEGKYVCSNCGTVNPNLRAEEQLKRGKWEPECPQCGLILTAQPTDEEKPLKPTSVYAMTKRHQEEMSLLIGRTYGIPTVALRYFNVYGPRQALSNPYTGCCAIFSSRIINNKPPYIFEDGMQTRDFVHVRDIASANLLAIQKNGGDYQALNVGTGQPTSIRKLTDILIGLYKSDVKPLISNEYRLGDIRHCYADIEKIKQKLGYTPLITLERGLPDLTDWVRSQTRIRDRFEEAQEELVNKGLAFKP